MMTKRHQSINTAAMQMMVGTRLMSVLCTPPHFVVNVHKIIVLKVLTHTIVGAGLFMKHNTHCICSAF